MDEENKKTEEKAETIEEPKFPEPQSIEEVKKSKKRRKRKIILLTLVGAILLPTLITTIYVFGGSPNKKLKPEMEEEIKKAYFELYGNKEKSEDSMVIGVYYGIYHGYVVVLLYDSYGVYDIINNNTDLFSFWGITFDYSFFLIKAYKNKHFYTLEEISEKNYLNVFDFWRIYNIHKKTVFYGKGAYIF